MDNARNTGRPVLYVDDDPQALRAVARVLADTELELDTADSADCALDMLQDKEYHVVMSDYCMPGMNGIRLLERLKHTWPDTVTVLITGYADLDTALRAINRVGLYRFLTKPWNDKELRATLRGACEQFELSRENTQLARQLEVRNVELRRVNNELDREVHRRTSQMLVGLLNALDHRDTETQGHSIRVGLYTRRLAVELGLKDREVLDIERGALLHDIGKIGVSDTILLKPGKLTPEEWEEMRRHTVYGFNILEPIEFLGEAALIVRNHHERYDGGGYPDGLEGDNFHIGARLFAIIDTYDAMTSDRPYRKALSPDIARAEILKHRGTQFHPECVDAFLGIPQNELDGLKARVALGEQKIQSLEDIIQGSRLGPSSTNPPQR